MNYILTLDQGTTSSRAILFDRAGHPAHSTQQEFKQIFPQPGWVEHDAAEIWSGQLELVKTLFNSAAQAHAFSIEDIAALAITNQRETTVLWDRATGKPLSGRIAAPPTIVTFCVNKATRP
jgi:glycerol kinase